MDIIDAKPTCASCHDAAASLCDSCWWAAWIRERDNARARADERDQYAREVAKLTEERDAAKADAAAFCTAWQWEMGEHGKTGAERDRMRQERDQARAQLHRLEEENGRMRGELRTHAAEVATFKLHVRDLDEAVAYVCTERDAARAAADEWAALAKALSADTDGPPCPGQRPKQVGPANFVMRGCKLADGHDGMCEPA